MPIRTPHRSESEVDRIYRQLNVLSNQNSWVLAIPDELLKEWWVAQVAWWGQHIQKLDKALATTGAQRTAASMELKIRLDHAKETLVLLKRVQHVLVCREHGIQGVTDNDLVNVDWPERMTWTAETFARVYRALSDYGVYDGSITGWERACEKCLAPLFKRRAAEAIAE